MRWTVQSVDDTIEGRRAKLAELRRKGPAGQFLVDAELEYIDRLLELRTKCVVNGGSIGS